MKVLVTGGAGFIGSTVGSALIDAGHIPIILDDFSAGARSFTQGRICYEGDIADRDVLKRIVSDHPDLEAVVHCAAFIVVPESVANPLRYYRNNVGKTLEFVECLQALGLNRLVFSSSAAIYLPGLDYTVDETSPVCPNSPYAATKAIVEGILQDVCSASDLKALSLRYFNPVGADPQRRTGLQLAQPSHALGKLIEAYEADVPFVITGVDWPTRDGSAIRDYIHVWDLARAHVHALERIDMITASSAYEVINVGTGYGTTVRELVRAFETVVGKAVDVVEGPSRPGDVVGSYTRNGKARKLLGWEPELTIEDAVRDAIEWASLRPSVMSRVG